MKIRGSLYYIPHIAMGFVIVAPAMPWFGQALGKIVEARWFYWSWGIFWFGVAFLLLWQAQRRGIFAPRQPDSPGGIDIIMRLMCSTVFAKAIYDVARNGLSGVESSKIILLVMFPAFYLVYLYSDFKKKRESATDDQA